MDASDRRAVLAFGTGGRYFDDIAVNRITGGRHTIEHQPPADSGDDGAADPGSTRILHLQLEGSGTMEQRGRTAVLRPGDAVLYSPAQPFTLAHSGESVIIRPPTRELPLPEGVVDELVGVRLDRDRPLVRAINPLTRQLATTLATGDTGVGTRMVHAAINMLGAVLIETSGTAENRGRPGQLDAVLQYIEENLHRPDLSVAEIAAANFMSARKLHGLFEPLKTTVAAWVRSRRLVHCRRELTDPAFAGLTIGEVAARWGFKDAAHFSRAFTDRFGASPRAFRTGHALGEVVDLSHRTVARAASPREDSPTALFRA
ncbi:helix-turn-helix domain-containing protein [uncultured Leifsonia sp.]|jgi:AraC-like DNA-binding protein|uniref:helix-turn-helix domain-containing protein n=1 Tax=uncultured Leifsonia sp. TaxID=340359 RepID=UPI0025EC4E90|nr:helix-turn-helix domain-containing protein [uncultured Leifsonia sp.]